MKGVRISVLLGTLVALSVGLSELHSDDDAAWRRIAFPIMVGGVVFCACMILAWIGELFEPKRR
jgi:hypothetical protein